MIKLLHKRFGWFECRFHPFDVHEAKTSPTHRLWCRYCGAWFTMTGLPYVNAVFTKDSVTKQPQGANKRT